MGTILPVAKALFTCDGHLGFAGQKSDLMGIFESITSDGGYPFVHPSFVVYSRLLQGQGTFPLRIDLSYAATGQYVGGSNVHQLVIPNRDKLMNVVVTLNDISFPQPGIYLVELFLDNQPIADTILELQ